MTIVKDPTQFLKGQFQPQADIIILHKEQATVSGLSAYFVPVVKDPEGLHAVPSIQASMFHLLCRKILIKPLVEEKKIRFFNGEACAISVMPYQNGMLIDGIKIEFPDGEGPAVKIADIAHVDRARKYISANDFKSQDDFLSALQGKALSFTLAQVLGTLPVEGNDVDIKVNLVRNKEDHANRISSISLINRTLNFGDGGSITAFFNKAREFLATPQADFVQAQMQSGHTERVQAIKAAAAAKKLQPFVSPA